MEDNGEEDTKRDYSTLKLGHALGIRGGVLRVCFMPELLHVPPVPDKGHLALLSAPFGGIQASETIAHESLEIAAPFRRR